MFLNPISPSIRTRRKKVKGSGEKMGRYIIGSLTNRWVFIMSFFQIRTEQELFKPLENFWAHHSLDPDAPKLFRTKHLNYLRKALSHLPAGHSFLDCSRPWLCYWTLHPLNLLGEEFSSEVIKNVSDFLSRYVKLF